MKNWIYKSKAGNIGKELHLPTKGHFTFTHISGQQERLASDLCKAPPDDRQWPVGLFGPHRLIGMNEPRNRQRTCEESIQRKLNYWAINKGDNIGKEASAYSSMFCTYTCCTYGKSAVK